MIFITSISPSHINQDSQFKAVNSWLKLGVKVYSLNCDMEQDLLKDKYKDVTFVQVKRTREDLFKKSVIPINQLIDFGVRCEDNKDGLIVLINSDIILEENKEKFEKFKSYVNQGFVYVTRHNYNEVMKSCIPESWGIDVFAFHKRIGNIFPRNEVFCMGVCFWDYWLPFVAMNKGVKLFWINEKWAYHKTHKLQWNRNHWQICVNAFRKENNIVNGALATTGGQIRRKFISMSQIINL